VIFSAANRVETLIFRLNRAAIAPLFSPLYYALINNGDTSFKAILDAKTKNYLFD
jgi:hypothetical protein